MSKDALAFIVGRLTAHASTITKTMESLAAVILEAFYSAIITSGASIARRPWWTTTERLQMNLGSTLGLEFLAIS